jgi:hypothetical protein
MLSMLASTLFKVACAQSDGEPGLREQYPSPTTATQHDEEFQVSTSHVDGEHRARAPRERQSRYLRGYL